MSAPPTRKFRTLAGGAGLLLVALGLLAVVRQVPEGKILLRPGGATARATRGPSWIVMLPFGVAPVWLELAPVQVETPIRLSGSQVSILVTARPNPEGSASILLELATTGVEQSVVAALHDVERGLIRDASDAEARRGLHEGLSRELEARSLVLVTLELGTVRNQGTRSPASSSSSVDAVLIGIDSADWDRIDPLIAEGRLPNLARLRSQGSWARLRSDIPTLSPLLWTTVVTGRPPDEHGVVDFVMVDPSTGTQTPISSSFRRVKALWNILTDAGMPVGVVGWWATWPAEAVEGVMISDRVAFSLFHFQQGERAEGLTYPASYVDRVAELTVDPLDVLLDEVRRFADVDAALFADSTRLLKQGGDEAYTHPVASLRKILASTHTYHLIALDLLSRGQPRWFAVYYQGLDEVNHRFGHLTGEAHPLADAEDRRRYGGVVDSFYEFQDRLLGEVLERLSARSTVMVLSDHGFANGKERPQDLLPYVEAGRPGRWHTLEGVWLLWGPPVRPGPLAGPPVRLDQITPTLLRLLSLPLADDMPGSPLESALTSRFLDEHPATHVASYEGGDQARTRGLTPLTGQADASDEMMARLRALGYLAPESRRGTPAAGGTSTVSSNYHANLGSIFAGRGELDRAREEFRLALQLTPGHLGALGGVIQIDMNEGALDAALSATLDLLSREIPVMDPVFYFIAAYLHAETGQTKVGLALFRDLTAGRPDVDQLFTGLGLLLQADGDVQGALLAYRQALDLRPAALYALQELYTLETGRGRVADLMQRCSLAIEEAPYAVMPYNWKALLLRRTGQTVEAEAAFRKALALDPDSIRTLVNLSSLLADTDRAAEAIPLLRHALTLDAALWEARVNLVVALGRGGKLTQAEAVFQEVDHDRESPSELLAQLLNAMAFAYYLNDAPAEARALLERSLQLDPAQTEARRLLDTVNASTPAA